MSLIEIEWSTDEYECEMCGSAYSDGAIVHIDGKLVYEQPALAHCYYSNEYCEERLRETILTAVGLPEITGGIWLEDREFIKHLTDNGHEVKETYEYLGDTGEYDTWSD